MRLRRFVDDGLILKGFELYLTTKAKNNKFTILHLELGADAKS